MADALSRKEPALMANLMTQEWELVEAFGQLVVNVIPKETSIHVAGLMVHSQLLEQVW